MFLIQDIATTEYQSKPLPIQLDSSALQEILRNDLVSCTPKYKKEKTKIPDALRALFRQQMQIYSLVEVWCAAKSFGVDVRMKTAFVD